MADYKILVVGAVYSTAQTIKSLIHHNFEISGIMGHEPNNINNVSGWSDLKSIASANGIDYRGFKKINDAECIEWAETRKPDIIFAVGFSQLLEDRWLSIPRLGCVGFHPTCLPKGRGRAPLAWAILEERCASATFFLMGEGVDDGPIFVQEIISLTESDDASNLSDKVSDGILKALDRWLPELARGVWNPIPQEEARASWYGKRTPLDGIIDWHKSAHEIDLLIKASTTPHPGAYTFYKNTKVVIHSSSLEKEIPIKGVVGRILLKSSEQGALVQCGIGLLWVRNVIMEEGVELSVGEKLGYYVEQEIYELWKRISSCE